MNITQRSKTFRRRHLEETKLFGLINIWSANTKLN